MEATAEVFQKQEYSHIIFLYAPHCPREGSNNSFKSSEKHDTFVAESVVSF